MFYKVARVGQVYAALPHNSPPRQLAHPRIVFCLAMPPHIPPAMRSNDALHKRVIAPLMLC
jgi:hypothetical protein